MVTDADIVAAFKVNHLLLLSQFRCFTFAGEGSVWESATATISGIHTLVGPYLTTLVSTCSILAVAVLRWLWVVTTPMTETRVDEERRAQKELTLFGTTQQLSPGQLDKREIWWKNQFEWLKIRGYLLRPRYAPDWVPSWNNSSRDWFEYEDSRNLQVYEVAHIIDATRLSDGQYVTLKRIKRSDHQHEVDIGLYFSSESLATQPTNHCVPFYDILSLEDQDTVIIVMPLLRLYSDPHFDTFGEVIECFRQLFEVPHADI
ncbi:hypothetical protein J3R83DRAFT_3249 [Lanmaoa asiatica]|nr:hypothetical protein J3R83DRAFT_3249 [Lanmaoa asiatica]